MRCADCLERVIIYKIKQMATRAGVGVNRVKEESRRIVTIG